MFTRRSSSPRQLFFHPRVESLESRRLLAGDVVSGLAAPHTLMLVGDDLDNQIQIKGGKNDGDLTVRGLNGTTVDGEAKQSFTEIQRLVVLTRGGDDSIRISKLSLVDFAPVGSTITQSFAEIQVRGGDGNDDISISNSSVAADGEGATFDAFAAITVLGDDGSDTITIFNVDVQAINGLSRTFAQIDVFGDINPSAPGNDVAIVRNADVRAFGGSSSNRAHIGLQELNGGGNDHYSVLNSVVSATGEGASSRLTLELGDGDDVGVVKNSSFGRLQARMGAGSDRLELRNNDIALLAFLDGGDGEDELIEKNNTGVINAINFEV